MSRPTETARCASVVMLVAAVASLILFAPPAQADNYTARDGDAVKRTFCSKLVGGLEHPCHIMFGMFGSTPKPLLTDVNGALSVNVLTAPASGSVTFSGALPAGTNLIGKVGIDQTTAGTTNGVVVNSSALPTGASTSAAQTTAQTSLSSIVTSTAASATAALQTTQNGYLDGLEGQLTTLDGRVDGLETLVAATNTKLDTLNTAIADTAASAIDQTKVNGVTVSTGNGVAGTGVQRVTIASDNTPPAFKTDQTTHGTTDFVAADLTKINGTAGLAGLGNTGTGAQRVFSAFAGATQYAVNTTSAATAEIIPLSGSLVTYVLFDKLIVDGTGTVTWKYGTGTNCGTGTTTLEGPYNLTAQNGWVEGNGGAPVMIVPAGKALCLTTSAGTTQYTGKLLAVQF